MVSLLDGITDTEGFNQALDNDVVLSMTQGIVAGLAAGAAGPHRPQDA